MDESLEQSGLIDGRFSGIDERVYSNGVHHLYGIDAETGKKRHISWADVADHYGYSLNEAQDDPDEPTDFEVIDESIDDQVSNMQARIKAVRQRLEELLDKGNTLHGAQASQIEAELGPERVAALRLAGEALKKKAEAQAAVETQANEIPAQEFASVSTIEKATLATQGATDTVRTVTITEATRYNIGDSTISEKEESQTDEPQLSREKLRDTINRELNGIINHARQAKAEMAGRDESDPIYQTALETYELAIARISELEAEYIPKIYKRWTPERAEQLKTNIDTALNKPVIPEITHNPDAEPVYHAQRQKLIDAARQAGLSKNKEARNEIFDEIKELVESYGHKVGWDDIKIMQVRHEINDAISARGETSETGKETVYKRLRLSSVLNWARKFKRDKSSNGPDDHDGPSDGATVSDLDETRRAAEERRAQEQRALIERKASRRLVPATFIGAALLSGLLTAGIFNNHQTAEASPRPKKPVATTTSTTQPKHQKSQQNKQGIVQQQSTPASPVTPTTLPQHGQPAPAPANTAPNSASTNTQTLGFKGDTLWAHARQNLVKQSNQAPTNTQVLAETNRLLSQNHLTWEQARSLPDGYQFQN